MGGRSADNVPTVWIVVLNWNGRRWLGNCLQSLSDLTHPHYETLLVDNGSTDGSVEFVTERFPWVHILENGENLGFAEGNNQGIRFALDAGADMVLVLNNDTKVRADFLEELVNAAKERGVAIVGAAVYHMDSERLQEAGMTCDPFGFPIALEAPKESGEPSECFYVSGSCMLLGRDFLEKGGLFDPRYFIFAEDLDLCWRAWLLGYRVLVAPRATVLHEGGGTISGGHEKGGTYETRSRRIYLRERNTLRTLLKNYGRLTLAVIAVLYPITLILESILWLYRAPQASVALVRAVGWNMVNLGDTLAARRHIQSIRVRSDRDVISKMRLSFGKWLKLKRTGIPQVRTEDVSDT